MKPSELNQILKEVVNEELTCESYSNYTDKLKTLKKRRDPDSIEEVNYTQTSSGQSVIAQGAPGSVIRFATENPEVMKVMRDWAKDCQWKEDPEEIDEMSDEEILRGVQRHYEGGIKAFIRDSQSKAEVPVGYKEGYGMGDMSKDPKKAFKKARWTVKFDEKIHENIKLSELKNLIGELIGEMWADIGNQSGDTGKEGPTGRSTEPGSDENLVNLYKGNKPGPISGLPSFGGGMNEETWPSPDDKLKQYEDVKEWERDNLDGFHKYIGEPLKNYGFLYKIGDLVPAGTYNRNNAMHLWNIAKKKQQENVKFGPPSGFGFHDSKKLYEAKGITSKEKLRSIIKESVQLVLKENIDDHEEKREVDLATQIKNLAHSISFDRDHPYFNHIVRIGKLADEILKLHKGKSTRNSETEIYDDPKQEQRSALGVTQETVSRTKKVLEQMLFQKRKK